VTSDELTQFAERYAEAWCSRSPDNVAEFYAKNGWISVNGAPPVPIAEVAGGFMRDFPDMVVKSDKLEERRPVPSSTGRLPERTLVPEAQENVFGSTAMNFGRSTMTD
jgi:hypothetical protein